MMALLRDQPLNLTNLPIEVLLDNVLPFVPAPDLSQLAQCNKLFSVLCADETIWKRKVLEDFNFSGQGTARTSGWKFIYKGLFKPRVFVWGEKANGRLGLQHIPKAVVPGVPYPIQLEFQGVRVVSLVAGGMSFHALDSEGRVHVWGTLNGGFGQFAAERHGFSSPAQQARTPHTLSLPSPIRSISCGRLHSSCLDGENKVWTFTNWGRPFKLSATILEDPDYTPKQIECGWGFSSMLTRSGEVFVWWPFDGTMGRAIQQKMRDMDSEGGKRALPSKDGVIPCVTWDLDIMPIRLPAIPDLPELSDTDTEVSKSQNIELIQIAAFDQHIIGLTNRGHVLKYGGLHDDTAAPNGRWEYLPLFSEVERIREHPAFSSTDDSSKPDAPQTMQITHISANFLHFVAYSTDSSSIVLIGDTNATPTTEPKIIPELQHKSVISVVVGDYHNAALTATGKLLTWGAYSNGGLGLGDPVKLEPGTPGAFANDRDLAAAQSRMRVPEPPAVSVPTEVRFDHSSKKPRERFCFSVTAAGWHTGALVIDLQQEDDEDELVENVPSDIPEPSRSPARSRWETPSIIPTHGIHRLGYPGRGGFHGGLPPPSS
ncbi:regulator of chromosome condensation 1/beta-lactamase-inhibitor protein II [Pholiota molesta]|nr:regulator of chromosome condensation 1/beta-lactamase-inhibitor protein II [Pholiota molesta]